MELERHGAGPKPAAAKLPAKPPMAPARPPAANPTMRPLPGVQPAPEAPVAVATPPVRISIPMISSEPMPAPPPIVAMGTPDPFPVAVAAPRVAAGPPVEEDEWEWEIAMARARAAADDVSAAATAMGFTKPTAPLPKITKPLQAATSDPMHAWPKTEELTASIGEETEVSEPRSAAHKRMTVIPVPALPVAANPSDVRPSHTRSIASPRTRMARGTAREDTVQMRAAPRAHSDETSPYIQLPPEVKPIGYAHANTRRAAAKHR
jgi:hypothetical protein